jgi:hypothetical protein
MKTAVLDSNGRVVGYRCYECSEVFDSLWDDTCNGCRAKERRHQEALSIAKQQLKVEDKNLFKPKWEITKLLLEIEQAELPINWVYGINKNYSGDITINFKDNLDENWQHFIGTNANKDGWVVGCYSPMTTEIEFESKLLIEAIQTLKELLRGK